MKNTFYDERMNWHLQNRIKILKEKGITSEHFIPWQWEHIQQAICRMYELGIIDASNKEIKQ